MRAPVILLLIAFTLQFNLSFAQPPGKGMLKLSDNIIRLAVNKNNQLVITTSDSEIALADSVNGIWHKMLIGALPDGTRNTNVKIRNACYFNADTAFVSGGIGNNYEEMDLIYRTTDGGKTWTPIKFGMNGWVYDAVFLDNGEAWLSVNEEGVAYTNNYGLTWKPVFANKKQRYARIFFNNKREGIFAVEPNRLAYTKDNGKTFINIPSPLQQGKYKKTDFFHEPLLDRVAIFHDYLLACQEDLVFYSRKDTINWIYMPGYRNFYTDPYNRALFLETNRGTSVKCDNKLKPVATFNCDSYWGFSRNGSLFSFDRTQLTQINAGNQLFTFPVYTNDTTEIVAHNFGWYTGHGNIGAVKNKIYIQEGRNGKWRYAFTLPFVTDSGYLRMKGDDTIMFVNRSNDFLFYYSIKDGQVEKRERKKMIADFAIAGIKKIIIAKNSSGDFYYYTNTVSFENINGKFVRTKLDTAALNGILLPKQIPDTLSYRKVMEFGKHIPDLYKKQLSFDELGFTRADYDSCKKHIGQFKAMLASNKSAEELGNCPFAFNVNNLDFSKLLSLVDRIGRVSPATLDEFLHRRPYFSTDEDYITIQLINADGKELLIHYRYYNGKQPYFFAWWLDLYGLHEICPAIEINRFLNDVLPNFLNDKQKVDLLQELVKFVYKRETLDN